MIESGPVCIESNSFVKITEPFVDRVVVEADAGAWRPIEHSQEVSDSSDPVDKPEKLVLGIILRWVDSIGHILRGVLTESLGELFHRIYPDFSVSNELRVINTLIL